MNNIIGIVAEKLGHSLSPYIHNYWSKKYKQKLKYQKFEISEKNLVKFFQSFKKNKKIKGFNVTIPYKTNFISLCDRITPKAKKIGSVNLVYKKNNLIIGDNTDIEGFKIALEKTKQTIENKTALILGAGGVVPSIIIALKKLKIDKIFITNRTEKKATEIKKTFSDVEIIRWGEIIDFDIIINATSLGLDKEDMIKLEYEKISKDKFFYDVIYNPKETNFLKTGKNGGNITLNGKMMFVYQALSAFKIWHGIEPDINEDVIKLLD